mmetsp:Transcript_17460/g.23559  ORF Transcript_17460/g.23559 Transcript_17460/m.23559 type:complete len:229 (+) Transcript_17460:224-910(+)|eukprot:CAMPEP_0185580328 /NCGR_PEP_ID=MMETSP0434-20130131/16124_1 /TAXON_ID=626734 ORGANISM="Favella taraikaensis, Strain Fe Narragansett Bay" /NCGR_SAMPLE_ID=MMETSP0434 /ASSEMBLY_ACC=CAM_ASM_000379 /LENGTH=228 /DNA_ID=CAMNT_0028198555 /DNA_START=216 /DNA_END=902 /DNA_ORIENTATION=-
MNLRHFGLEQAHLDRLSRCQFANVSVLGTSDHLENGALVSIVTVPAATSSIVRQLTVKRAIVVKLASLQVLLPVPEKSHRSSSVDNRGVHIFLNLCVQVNTRQVFQLFRVAALPKCPIFLVHVLISIGVDAVDIQDAQGVQIMLDAVANKNALAVMQLQICSDGADCGRIGKPFPLDAMNFFHAAIDAHFRVDESVEHDTPVFIDSRGLTNHALVASLVHLTVQCDEE